MDFVVTALVIELVLKGWRFTEVEITKNNDECF